MDPQHCSCAAKKKKILTARLSEAASYVDWTAKLHTTHRDREASSDYKHALQGSKGFKKIKPTRMEFKDMDFYSIRWKYKSDFKRLLENAFCREAIFLTEMMSRLDRLVEPFHGNEKRVVCGHPPIACWQHRLSTWKLVPTCCPQTTTIGLNCASDSVKVALRALPTL